MASLAASLLDALEGDGPSCVVSWSKPALRAQISAFDLSGWGIPPKARIGLMLPNGTVNAVGLLAAMQWYCVVTINPSDTAKGAEARLRSSGATCLVSLEQMDTASAAASAAGVPLISLVQGPGDLDGAFRMPRAPRAATPRDGADAIGHEDYVLILFTSGTTGNSKRVPFTLRRLLASGAALAASLALTPDDVGLNTMPLYHVGGIACNLLCPLVSNSRMSFHPGFSAAGFFEALAIEGISWMYAAPAMWQKIVQHPRTGPVVAPRLRLLRSGAAALPHADALALRQMFGEHVAVLPTYSMTECMPVCAPPPTYRLEKPGSVGLPCIPLKILGKDGEEVPAGTVGEVTLIGLGKEHLFGGYERDGDGKLVVPDAAEDQFPTGDRGYVDADGWLYHVGRSKECVNRGGEIISPVEVEDALFEVEGIVRGDVMAFAAPHAALEEVVAVALPSGSTVELSELRRVAAQRLPTAHLPQVLVRVPQLPRTAGTNKLQRTGYAKTLGLPKLNGGELFTFSFDPEQAVPLSLAPFRRGDAELDVEAGGVAASTEVDSLSRVVYTPGGRSTPMTPLSYLYFLCMYSILLHHQTGFGDHLRGPTRWIVSLTATFTTDGFLFCGGWMDYRWPARTWAAVARKLLGTLVIVLLLLFLPQQRAGVWLVLDLFVYRLLIVPLPLLGAPTVVRQAFACLSVAGIITSFFVQLPYPLAAQDDEYAYAAPCGAPFGGMEGNPMCFFPGKRMGTGLFFYLTLPMLMPSTCLAALPTDPFRYARVLGREVRITKAFAIRSAALAVLLVCFAVAITTWRNLPHICVEDKDNYLEPYRYLEQHKPSFYLPANYNMIAVASGHRFLALVSKFVVNVAAIFALCHLMPLRASLLSMLGDCALITFVTSRYLPPGKLNGEYAIVFLENWASHVGHAGGGPFIFFLFDSFFVLAIPFVSQVAMTFYVRFEAPLKKVSWLKIPYPQPPSVLAMMGAWTILFVVYYLHRDNGSISKAMDSFVPANASNNVLIGPGICPRESFDVHSNATITSDDVILEAMADIAKGQFHGVDFAIVLGFSCFLVALAFIEVRDAFLRPKVSDFKKPTEAAPLVQPVGTYGTGSPPLKK
ncbi:hypothetical protein AB1Y20_005459 [Prymnesium parvum]|uniref:AMP-dependent synthetase/ligase domain-containing protein n=1 Tax=Prymnesium parvum TaxID=97485 RepID=A0AB34J6A4_PRYPA